jgi:L-alanine-DL-glutamate epimerase-like enolase superfamily enzyme
MKDLQIDRVEVFTVGPPTQRLAWALDMPGQYMTGTIVRVTTRGGLVGVAGAANYSDFQFESSVAETLRCMAPTLIGRSPLQREAIWHAMLSKTLPRAPQAQSLLDVALWDLTAQASDLPLWQLLGGARDRILSYASTALLESPDAYVDAVVRLREEGFRAIKFHCWCERGRDLAMVRRVRASGHDAGLALMLDVEQRYEVPDALAVGRELGELGYVWFEAPLDDYDLHGYRRLAKELAVDIIPAGNSVVDHRMVAFGLDSGCWDRVRIDVMTCGGLTGALKVMGLAAAHGTTVELQCWGYTLAQAANLHLMLGQPNCSYFEQPTPYEAFEYGSDTVIRTDADGFVHAPAGTGLGIQVNWGDVEHATLGRIDCTAATA